MEFERCLISSAVLSYVGGRGISFVAIARDMMLENRDMVNG